MMNLKCLLLVLICGIFMFTACGDDDNEMEPNENNDNQEVPQLVLDEFNQRYSQVKEVYWSRVQQYHVARFNAPISRAAATSYRSSAWFTADGRYWQSDEEIDFSKLPELVKKAFLKFKEKMYAHWHIEECEIVVREGMGIVFVVKIENEEEEREISLSELGDILKDKLDKDDDTEEEGTDDILPVVLPEEIEDALDELFNDSITILEYEEEENELEVDILDGNRHKEVTFDLEYNWVSTEYEITIEEVLNILKPEVAEKLLALGNKFGVDLKDPALQEYIEIEFVQHVTEGNSMEIEFEFGEIEFEIHIDDEGNITFGD